MLAAPIVTGVLETALYVVDLDIAAGFYQRVFGFTVLLHDARMCALAVPGGVLLLFRVGGSLEPSIVPGGVIPSHGATGRGHVCFAIPRAQLDEWRRRLAEVGVVIESEVRQTFGGTSLYFRDPDDHSVEVATPGLWATY